jgi:predicted enzyme related to lactoylglutathione lyase
MVTQRGNDAAGAVGWFRGIVVDADDIDLLAAFWGAVLGVTVVEHFDDWVMLSPSHGGAYLAFQPREVGGGDAPARLRLDVEVGDLDGATQRIETLGGRLVDVVDEAEVPYHLMADPEGNEFSIVLPLPSGTGGKSAK